MTSHPIDRRDPEAVARAAASAMHEERWDDVAALCDAGALARWREQRAERGRAPAPVGGDALAPAALFARELAERAPRRQLERQLGPELMAGVDDATLRYPEPRVLGHVAERFYDREIAHVLTRVLHPHGERDPHAPADDDAPVSELLATDMRVDVTVLLRAPDGTWGIVPDDNLLGLRTWNVVAMEDEQPDADWEGETPDP